jgi:hypothetical protein
MSTQTKMPQKLQVNVNPVQTVHVYLLKIIAVEISSNPTPYNFY